jgi:hypothetical protein
MIIKRRLCHTTIAGALTLINLGRTAKDKNILGQKAAVYNIAWALRLVIVKLARTGALLRQNGTRHAILRAVTVDANLNCS